VVDRSGVIVAASSNLEGVGLIAEFRPRGDHAEVRTERIPVPGEGEDDFRVTGLNADGPIGAYTIYVVANLDRVKETRTAVRRLLFYGLPLLLLLVGLISWFVVGRALRPVEAMRAEVAGIGARDLSRRVPEPRVHDEIGRLATTMNGMLDRLQSSADRQRRFVADASHELQSPLASSLADLEVALAHPETTRWEETAAGLVSDNHRMTRLVGDLLYLAQTDDGSARPRQTLVDLNDIVLEEIARVRVPDGVVVDGTGVAPMEVRGDPDQLARVVRNLLENAGRYAQSSITVALTAAGTDGSTGELVVADDGPGVPAGSQEQIFERFTRLDDSRSRDTGGTGLGLAIAREIVVNHGGTLALDTTAPGARFVVRLPTTG
jgi:signal transduction histidine kinase